MKVNKQAIKRRILSAIQRRQASIRVSLSEAQALIEDTQPAPVVSPESLRDLPAETLSALKAELKSWNSKAQEWTE